jgi:excisionase family DNA binding protein
VTGTVALRPLLTKRELADLLRCSPRTVDRLRSRGLIAAVKFTPGGRVAFRREDVEALLDPEMRPPYPARADELEWS